jgi:receptor protein-tyrosine kinase
MGEIHDALREAKRTSPGSAPAREAPRGRRQDPEILETFRSLAPPAPANQAPTPIVPVSPEKRGLWRSRDVIVDARGPAAEALRHLALRLRRELDARSARSVAVLSALRAEGKTTMACNLALALASLDVGRGVALIDLDLRKPNVAKSLEIVPTVGIESVLAGTARLHDVCVSIDVPPLDVYPALCPQHDAHQILSQPALVTLLRDLEREYEIVVVDTPPVLLVPDAALILGPVKAAIAVGRAGRSTHGAIQAMIKLLPDERLIGAVLNEGSLPVGAGHYGYYADDASDPDAS